MTEEKLRSYRAVRAELADVLEQLKDMGVSVTVTSAAKFPYEKRAVTYCDELPPTPEVRALLERAAELRRRKTEVETFCDSIEDATIRRIISLRYIRGRRKPSWQYVAMETGYCAEHTPKRKLKKFLEMSEMSEIV